VNNLLKDKCNMKKSVGIWVDHKKAIIVSMREGEERLTCIESGVEPRVRLSGGSRSSTPYGPQEGPSERGIEERRNRQLSRYYRRIIRRIGDAWSILIFGPGEAKVELEREMKRSKTLASRIVGIQPADKMTERQIAAKVRKFFASDSP
jgi:hypothetical protein